MISGRYEMEESRVNQTLENILDAIGRICDGIGNCMKPETEMNLSLSVFTLARAYDLIAQYDETGYIEDGEDE
jgi:hypothetical protein